MYLINTLSMNKLFENIVNARKITVKPYPVIGSYLDVYPESDDIEYCNDALINTQYGLVFLNCVY